MVQYAEMFNEIVRQQLDSIGLQQEQEYPRRRDTVHQVDLEDKRIDEHGRYTHGENRFLTAEIRDNGHLVITGQGYSGKDHPMSDTQIIYDPEARSLIVNGQSYELEFEHGTATNGMDLLPPVVNPVATYNESDGPLQVELEQGLFFTWDETLPGNDRMEPSHGSRIRITHEDITIHIAPNGVVVDQNGQRAIQNIEHPDPANPYEPADWRNGLPEITTERQSNTDPGPLQNTQTPIITNRPAPPVASQPDQVAPVVQRGRANAQYIPRENPGGYFHARAAAHAHAAENTPQTPEEMRASIEEAIDARAQNLNMDEDAIRQHKEQILGNLQEAVNARAQNQSGDVIRNHDGNLMTPDSPASPDDNITPSRPGPSGIDFG